MSPPFTAVLLAGGKSRRMGQDKAYLPSEWKGASMPLWERQLAVLRSVSPEKLVISGPQKQGYPGSIVVFADEWTGVGPLGGIATCLRRTRNALLLVLAIDLPKIQSGFLKKLLGRCEAGRGVVPVHQSCFEPLAAIYPKAALGVALEQLKDRDYALQHFIDKLLKNRLMIGCEVDSSELPQLTNWNTPEDAGLAP
ncbi:MAG: molybdenum cofactor guanylyltransferase [Verrucomicrobia bacterium]|nr:molybdenum cofactor guanylyltransferase [Verrucomicrobiota bacterium]